MDRKSTAGRSPCVLSGAIPKSTFNTPIECLEARIAPAALVVSTLKSAGAGSLSAAITQANTNGGSNTITFSVHGTIHLTAPLPAVTDDLTIQGPGATKLTIDGGHKNQILYLGDGSNPDTIAISGVTLAHGSNAHTTSTSNYYGGAIEINNPGGSVTITGSVITGNQDLGTGKLTGVSSQGGSSYTPGIAAEGGGIANLAGALTIQNSKITGNAATGLGGKSFYYKAQYTAYSQDGGSAYGGAIFNQGTLTIQNSIISGNSATGGKGSPGLNPQVIHYSGGYTTTVVHTGIGGGNGGNAAGGAIFNKGGTVTIEYTSSLPTGQSIISGNTVKAGSGGNGGNGANGFPAAAPTSPGLNFGTNGYAGYNGGSGGNATGGGIASNTGSVTVHQSIISGNKTTAGSGGKGGVGGRGGRAENAFYYSGTMTQYYATAPGNGGYGGNGGNGGAANGAGIYSTDSLTITNSTVSGNIGASAHAGKFGAGGKAGSGSLNYNGTLYTGTVGTPGTAGTYYGTFGGGIDSHAGTLSLSQVTIAQNKSSTGGGISVRQDSSATIHNCTIALNTALLQNGGGGLFASLDPGNDPVNIVSTIIGENSALITKTKMGGNDVAGTINITTTLIEAAGNATINGTAITGNPLLGALGYHPFPSNSAHLIETMLPKATSPAVVGGPGSNPDSLTGDANGAPFGSSIFIGAVQTT